MSQERSRTEHKSQSRSQKLLDDFVTLTKSPLYAEQFSAERLADAMAICREE